MPWTSVCVVRGVAESIVGAACPWLADPTSTMPVPTLDAIELDRMLLSTPEITSTPAPRLNSITFPAPKVVPPIVLLEAPPSIRTPSRELLSWLAPKALVPMSLPSTRLPVASGPFR